MNKKRMKVITVILVVSLTLIACGFPDLLGTSPVNPPAFDPSKVALEMQTTAMSLQLTQAGQNAQGVPTTTVSLQLTQAALNAQDVPTQTPYNQNSQHKYYKVIHRTGLYASLTSEEQLDTLEVGTILIPAYDNTDLTCETQYIGGITLTLCLIEVQRTGQIGWVLSRWIERK